MVSHGRTKTCLVTQRQAISHFESGNSCQTVLWSERFTPFPAQFFHFTSVLSFILITNYADLFTNVPAESCLEIGGRKLPTEMPFIT